MTVVFLACRNLVVAGFAEKESLVQVTFMQLFPLRIGMASNATCDDCGRKEILEYVLRNCLGYKVQR